MCGNDWQDGNGVLEKEELLHLADWVWEMFHPDSKPLSKKLEVRLGHKLLYRCDSNHDGKMTFDEFSGWFTSTIADINRFRREYAHRKKAKAAAAAAAAAAKEKAKPQLTEEQEMA